MATKVKFTEATSNKKVQDLAIGAFFIHSDRHQRLVKCGADTWYIHTTKPEANSAEAFVSILNDKFIEDNKAKLSKNWETAFYSQHDKDWFLTRYPKLLKVEPSTLEFKANGEFITNGLKEDRIYKMVSAMDTEKVVVNQADSMTEEELTAILIKKNPELAKILLKK